MLQRIISAILLVVGLMAPRNAFAAEDTNRLELPQKIEVEKGCTELQLPIMLTNTDEIAGFQCDLYLPDGFSVATDEYDDYVMDLARTTTKRHSLATRVMSDGALRIVLSSITNASFSGNSGAVLNITVKVSDNVAAGSYNVSMKNVVLTDPEAARYTSADVTGTIVVNKAEGGYSEDNKLELQEEITIRKGTTEMGLPVLLTNKDEISGFQCDLCLPEGFAVATDEYGDYLIDLARTTTKRHSMATRVMPDGALRIVISSMTNATFSDNSGAVLNITVKVGNDITPGSYNVNLKNVVLTDPDAARYTSADVTGILVIKEEQPVTVTAKNITMVYGDEVPELTYTTEGAELKGIPSLTCEATTTSPVGTYPIVVSKGTIENKKVTYVNGVLTITKAPLKISVGNYEKKQYDPMPEFVLSYEGFKNNETKEGLTKQPTVSCEANEDSAPGEYAIVVDGAEAANYKIEYVGGKLSVTEPDSYTLTYMVDGEVYQSFTIKYKETITPIDAPRKEGYAFSGWDGLPRSMPAKDVIVKGYFTINSYTITYVLDGEVYSTETIEYGAKIVPPVIPGLEEYTIWEDVPATMPASDITIYGKAKDIIDSLTPVLSKGEGDVYDLNGRRLSAPQKGLNIIRMRDGTTRKVMVK